MAMKTKQLTLVAATLLAVAKLSALTSGDDAIELRDLEYLANGPIALTPAKIDDSRKEYLRILVVARASHDGSRDALPLINDLAIRFPDAKFVVISPDPASEVKKLFGTHKDLNFAAAVDTKKENSRLYMGSGAVYPRAFVINYQGKIIWDGEVIDLEEMLTRLQNGTFDPDVQKKISPALQDLQSRLRSGEDRMAAHAAKNVLDLDPGNAAALRMRIFMLESTNRVPDAWALAGEELKKSPQNPRLYLLLLDLASRHAGLSAELAKVAANYLASTPSNSASDGAVAWNLLNGYPFDPELLRLSGLIVSRSLPEAIKHKPELGDADLFSATALYCSRIGRLDKAHLYQQKVCDVLEKIAPHRLDAAKKLEAYYRQAKDLGK